MIIFAYLLREIDCYEKIKNICGFENIENSYLYESVSVKHVLYKKHQHIATESLSVFRIEGIIIQDKNVIILCEEIIKSNFIEHFQSHECLESLNNFFYIILLNL